MASHTQGDKFDEKTPLLPKEQKKRPFYRKNAPSTLTDIAAPRLPSSSSAPMNSRMSMALSRMERQTSRERSANLMEGIVRKDNLTMRLLSKFQKVEFLQNDGEFKELDAEQVTMVAKEFGSIVQASEGEAANISCKQMFSKIFTFKNRPIQSANLLHFAIWFTAHSQEEAHMVEAILKNLEDPDDVFLPATYRTGHKTVHVSAIHIAAGLGQKSILKILTQFVCSETSEEMRLSEEQFVNQWALATTSGTDIEAYLDTIRNQVIQFPEDIPFQKFYQCIHESTYAGYPNVTMWLLEKRAEPDRANLYGITPLHFVAFCSISGCLESAEAEELGRLVKELQRTGIGLAARADMSGFIKEGVDVTNVTPLEVALSDASRFPQTQLSLLAPCLSEALGAERTYFDDIKTIADASAEGALKLVREIADLGKDRPVLLRRFCMEAQQGGKSDMLASIFYVAPLAAAEILELLEIEVKVADPSHYPIPTATRLRGILFNVPMRCSYQADCTQKHQIRIPVWKRKTVDDPDSAPLWHQQLVPRPPRARKVRSSSVKSVKVVACALPGILDIDILMAIARLKRGDYQGVLSKKLIQGAIFCLWSNLLENHWMQSLIFATLDLCSWVLMAMFAETIRGTRLLTVCQICAAASVLRSSLWVVAFAAGYCRKWQLHSAASADPTLAQMWSATSSWFWSIILPNITHAAIGLKFAIDVSNGDENAARTEFDDTLLGLLVIMATVHFASLWRLSDFGTRIFAIQQTIMSAAVNQMLFITFLILGCFIVVLVVLSRHQNLATAIGTYRGFLFGDGDGFTAVGMDEHAHHSLLAATVAGSFALNIVVVNIIIAIYGHEYDRAENSTPWLFLMGRVQYCVTNTVGWYLIPWSGPKANRAYQIIAISFMVASLCVGFHFHTIRHFWLAAFLLAAGQSLWLMAMIQCDWFSPEGVDSEGEQRFLWVCHALDWQLHWSSPEETEKMQASEEQRFATQSKYDDLAHKVNSMEEVMEERFDTLLHKMEAALGQPRTSRDPS